MNITTANLGWIILAWLVAGYVLGNIQCWFDGQYEVTRHGFRVRGTRRWYGTRAHVCLRAEEDNDEAERWLVLGWDQEDCEVPWIRVINIDDEDARSRWAPVTDFAPYAVRRLRPWVFRYRRLAIPFLFSYWPLRQPAGYLGDGA